MKARLHPIWGGGRDGYRYSVLFEGKLLGRALQRRWVRQQGCCGGVTDLCAQPTDAVLINR